LLRIEPPRFSGLPSGLELLSLGVLLPDDALDKLLFSRAMEPARGVLSPVDEDATLLDGDETRKGLISLSFRTTLRSPVSILSVSTPDFSSGSAFGGCSETGKEKTRVYAGNSELTRLVHN